MTEGLAKTDKLIARWQNSTGKRWLELYEGCTGSLLYKGAGRSGMLSATLSKEDAIAYCHRLVRGEPGVKRTI